MDIRVHELFREDIESEQLVDFINGNKTYAKAITILNKIDLVDEKFVEDVSKMLKTDFIPTSADSNKNINELKERYNELEFIRIYLDQRVVKLILKNHLL